MTPVPIYSYVWKTSRDEQMRICFLTAIIAPLAMVPLELQRRIVDHAVNRHEVLLLAVLGAAYLGVILVQGGLKYCLNLSKGWALEKIARDMRTRVINRQRSSIRSPSGEALNPIDQGTAVSIASAEAEEIGGFASESLATPLLQLGTILWVAVYLIWVEPLIAGLAILIYAPQLVILPRVQGAINRLARKRISLVRGLGRAIVGGDVPKGAEQQRQFNKASIIARQILNVRVHIYRRKFFLTFLGNFLDSLGPIIVLVVGGYLVIQNRTDISTLVVFISGFQKIAEPWDQLVNFYRSVSNARVTYALAEDALSR